MAEVVGPSQILELGQIVGPYRFWFFGVRTSVIAGKYFIVKLLGNDMEGIHHIKDMVVPFRSW